MCFYIYIYLSTMNQEWPLVPKINLTKIVSRVVILKNVKDPARRQRQRVRALWKSRREPSGLPSRCNTSLVPHVQMLLPCSCPFQEAFPAMFKDTSFNGKTYIDRLTRQLQPSGFPRMLLFLLLEVGSQALNFCGSDYNVLVGRKMDANVSIDPSTVAAFYCSF